MRNYKATIIAVIVLVLAVAALVTANYFLKKDDNVDVDESNASSVSIFDAGEGAEQFKSENVVEIESKNEEFFSLYYADGEWYSNSHIDLEVYTSSVEDIISNFLSLKGVAISDFASLADYSIDEKSPYTTLVMKDGTALKLKFGVEDSQGNRYVCVDGKDDTVYRIYETNADKIMVTRGLLVRLSAFVFSDNFNASFLQIKKKGELLIEASGKFVEAEIEDGEDTVEWSVIAPIKIDGNDKALNELIASLTDVSLESLVDGECEDFSEYGLSNPLAEYYLIFKNKEGATESASIKLGSKTSDGASYYCMIDERTNHVYKIAASLIKTDIKIEDYIDGYVFYEMTDSIESIELTFNGEKNVIEHEVMTEGDRILEEYYFNNRYVHSEDEYQDENLDTPKNKLTHLITALYEIEVETVEVPEPETKGESLCKVVYNRFDGTSVTVECFRRDNTTVYIYENGEYAGGYMRISLKLNGSYDDFGVLGTLEAVKEAMK